MRHGMCIADTKFMGNLFKKSFMPLMLLGLLTTGCVPQFEKANGDLMVLDSSSAEGLLSKTSTGNQSLGDLTTLRNQGYTISYLSMSSSDIQSVNGHNGGGYKISGSAITIYVSNGLASQEQAHVIAHELVHIKDDLEVDFYLRSYPYVSTASQNFVSTYKTQGVNNFDQRVVSYVLGTLFCTEARAYSRNQQLANEGLQTNFFAKGSSLPQFIDQAYIAKFGVSYGSYANNMASWCLSNSSMTQIQGQLVW
ncbi:hypothetical protein NWE73_04390 [Bdellovibrio sp. PAP01]|uniref:Peptidase M48 domain-containing protein n=2 Tax=Bdellovibrio svalbardensis TaxID=2972972 RepID=A0ABT6DFG6_9BACT|nr:hypothetical protein [Bdellovibrio svalbardensis]